MRGRIPPRQPVLEIPGDGSCTVADSLRACPRRIDRARPPPEAVISLDTSWPGITLDSRLAGGSRTETWTGFYAGSRVVVRKSTRSPESRLWEWTLLNHLAQHGIGVPHLLRTADGRLDHDGWHVYPFVTGEHPDEDDPRQAAALAAVHAVTTSWPQRPGSASSVDLHLDDRGGDIDFGSMPTELVATIREAWSQAGSGVTSVVHGDAGPSNAIIDARGRCVLIDWDEARVDHTFFDLPSGSFEKRAALAWEVATCWGTEPD
ncbi:hypothetical protein CH304_07680 [Rhodococcus sp. 15-649-1-2]|nr:hypothetical protein CH304_07680 [Rhodococcus sp. 15-649-1-2]